MRVALFGGTGFIGRYITDELIHENHMPVLLVRPGSVHKVSQPGKCITVYGDIEDMDAVRDTLDQADAVVYSIGILREFPRNGITFEKLHYQGVVRAADAAKQSGVRRFILISAHGVRYDGTPYQATKFRAEEYLRASGLDWTIFRPSLVFGDPKGTQEFCSMIRDTMINPPLPVPLFYRGILPFDAGRFRFTPVHVENVAQSVVRSLDVSGAAGKTCDLGGPDTIEWRTLIGIIAEACGRKKIMMPVPFFAVNAVAAVFGRYSWFPATRDQLAMLVQGNECDSSQTFRDFGITPSVFDARNLAYLRNV